MGRIRADKADTAYPRNPLQNPPHPRLNLARVKGIDTIFLSSNQMLRFERIHYVDAASNSDVKLRFRFHRVRAPVKQRSNIFKITNTNLRFVAFLLLALVGHALFLSYTHHHSTHVLGSSALSISQDTHTPEEHQSQSGHDNHCVTCQLQRDFASPVSSSATTIWLTPELAGWEEFLCQFHSTERFSIPSGRAPPLV